MNRGTLLNNTMSIATAAATFKPVGARGIDEAKCEHYAHFTHELDRIHFDTLYWSLFFVVIGILFAASWIYQSYVSIHPSIHISIYPSIHLRSPGSTISYMHVQSCLSLY